MSPFRSLRLLLFLLKVVQPLHVISPRAISIQQQKQPSCSLSSLFLRQTKLDGDVLDNDNDNNNNINNTRSPSSSSSFLGLSDDRRRYIPRLPQIREKPKNQRRKKYWFDLKNVEMELRLLWKSQNVTLDDNEPPPIPNETLLNYWKRHDLRAAIVTHNGRNELSIKLGGAFVIPGRWKEAVQTSIVKELIDNQRRHGVGDASLKPNVPPLSPQQIKQGKVRAGRRRKGGGGEEQQQQKAPSSTSSRNKTPRGGLQKTATTSTNKRSRKSAGYWTNQQIIAEMYEYLDRRRLNLNLPSVYQPQLSELPSDLRNAMNRFGSTKIFRQAGLVPYHEWKYIEGFLDMLLLLKQYLDEHYDGKYTEFPKVYKITDNNDNTDYQRLHSMIQYYGGRKFLASKLDMLSVRERKRLSKLSSDVKTSSGIMYWGDFDLIFAIRLLTYVRNGYMKKYPPLSNPAIEMPTQQNLCLSSSAGEEGIYLHQKIQEYGGYENVARRLQLDLIQF